MRGKKRCRMHGGAQGSGAPRGKRNGAFTHGHCTTEALALRKWCCDQLRSARQLIK
ncbi:hypothetical protein [Methylobacterium sp. Leaf99]|uniref:hypothetical protein n=1 Tax=Methylobacterium sp. Leaf99 TaxID=1736251 RepID=UPI002378F975|nr:hypothetical protein [Methylobacterium sp. Leaf99]